MTANERTHEMRTKFAIGKIAYVFMLSICATVVNKQLLSRLLPTCHARPSKAPLAPNNDYAIIFDAGSSGSRMYVFEWPANFSVSKGHDLVVNQLLSCKTKDSGLDKIRSQSELIASFSPCIQQASDIIPLDRQAKTYIFLGATAGMRLLELRNKTLCDKTFDYARAYFRTLNFLFADDSQVRTLSGHEEGTSAWIAANYFENNFGANRITSQPGESTTKGIVDIGGASSQIVFVPKQNSTYGGDDDTSELLRIGGKTYQPFAHSFICRGIDEVRMLHQAQLLKRNGYKKVALSPCFPAHSVQHVNSRRMYDSPCTNGLLPTFSHGFDVNRLQPEVDLVFGGSSDRKRCEQDIKSLLKSSAQCAPGEEGCSIDGIRYPNTSQSLFWGFSNYFYTIKDTAKIFNTSQNYTLDEFRNATDVLCSRNISELRRLSGSRVPENYLVTQCFLNVYTLIILERYGIQSFDSIKFAEKINGFTLNWPLGYLIKELNREELVPIIRNALS